MSGGELSPSLHSHADLSKYRTGLALCENWFILAQGGVTTRSGFKYINEILDSDSLARLIPFQFNTEQAYPLVFTDQKMQVVRNGGMVLEADKTISGATQANPIVLTITAHGYSDGDDIYIDNVVGMTELNGRFFRVANKATNTVELTDYAGNNIDGTTYNAYASAGTSGKVYTLATPWLEADLFRLKYTQSADVMTVTHPDYDTRDISRTGHAAWSITTVAYAAGIDPPTTGLAVAKTGTASGAANKVYRYVVTSVNAAGSESVASAVVASTSANALSVTYGNTVSWNTVTGAVYYNVYKEFSLNSGIFGWIGEADEDGSPSFDDYNFGPDMSITPPIANDPITGTDDRPAAVTYHQQRRCFGGTNNNPQTFYATRTGDFDNMDYSRPLQDSDSIEATLAAREVNEIRHLLSLDALIVFTSGGEWLAGADQDRVLSPSNINFQSQGFRGSAHVPPLVVGETAIFVQEKGSRVRDLQYTFESDKYTGNDLSIMSRHLFEQHTIVDWCYAQEPYSIVWAVRDDGVLLSMTYLREHGIFGWARHVTDGSVESVCAVSEGMEDVVYAIVKRTIGGVDKRYIERLSERTFSSLEDSFCVDSGLTYDGAATTNISNLYHLEGETVVALADGNVVENLTVSNGQVTLPNAASKVHVGLSYNCDFQTLEISSQQFVTQSRKKSVARIALRVLDSRGLRAGKDTSHLFEFKERTQSINYGDIPLQTGEQRVISAPGWSDYGQVYVRQSYPLPSTVVAVIPEVV
jgi:hypothetical protein